MPTTRSLPIALCLVLLALSPAFARDRLFLTGAEGGAGKSYNYFTFLAVVAPLSAEQLGSGAVQKYWVDFSGYDYRSGEDTISATAFGAEAALGYQSSGRHGWGGAYAGLRYSHTSLSPDNPESSVRGSQFRPTLQLEGERNLSRDFRINGIGRYIPFSDAYWTRGRIMYRLRSEIFTGPELIAHGDPDYRAWQAGWFLTGIEIVPRSSLGAKGGIRKTEKESPGWYLGVEFSRLF